MFSKKTLVLTKYIPGMTMNCYLYFCPETRKGIVIDPADDALGIMNWAEENGVNLEGIVLTHGHIDHIGAVEELRNTYGLKVSIHEKDLPMLADPMLNMSVFAGGGLSLNTAGVGVLKHGDVIRVGNLSVEVLHTPGHTPGGICLKTSDGIFSGDTLFKSSVGRSDFPGGDMNELIGSIQTQLMTLPDALAVYPGHEDMTTIGQERMFNMFLR